MWIVVMGAEGTGKKVVGDILIKRNFDVVTHKLANETQMVDLNYVTMRLAEQLAAQSVMHKKDIFTYRTIWDTLDVMAPVSRHMMKSTPEEETALSIFSKNLNWSEHIQPPHAVVLTKLDKRQIQDRLLLNGRQPNDEQISKQLELYAEFINRVRVPVIELNMGQDPIAIRDELNFSIDSMKATHQASQTIWRRSFFL